MLERQKLPVQTAALANSNIDISLAFARCRHVAKKKSCMAAKVHVAQRDVHTLTRLDGSPNILIWRPRTNPAEPRGNHTENKGTPRARSCPSQGSVKLQKASETALDAQWNAQSRSNVLQPDSGAATPLGCTSRLSTTETRSRWRHCHRLLSARSNKTKVALRAVASHSLPSHQRAR